MTHWVIFTPLRLEAQIPRAKRESSQPFGRVEFGGEPPSCPAYQAGQQFRVHNVDTSSKARGVLLSRHSMVTPHSVIGHPPSAVVSFPPWET